MSTLPPFSQDCNEKLAVEAGRDIVAVELYSNNGPNMRLKLTSHFN